MFSNVIFFPKFEFEKFWQDAKCTDIIEDSYQVSYFEFVSYFEKNNSINKHNLIIGINFTYGWMPTIFHFKSNNLNEVLVLLNRVKSESKLNEDELSILIKLFNNSLVGTSKILHFINPNLYPILDSRVYNYLFGKNPHYKQLNNIKIYFNYINLVDEIINHQEFEEVNQIISGKVGYQISKIRVIDIIMYTNAKNKLVPEK